MISGNVRDRLAGRTLWIPPMTYVGARLAAAAFRSVGVDATITPASDERTLELGGLHCSGQECYPEKVTLGDFLRIIYAEDFDPDRTAFFMPTANGPCRFGQYAPYLRHVLGELGYGDVPVLSPTSSNSYEGVTDLSPDMIRRMWHGLVAGDILHRMLLKTRPYAHDPADADRAFETAVERLERAVEDPDIPSKDRLPALIETLAGTRELFHAVGARYTRGRPLIGVVGEIFCRLHCFSNYNAIRKIEAHGGEAWLSEVTEWVWYTNWAQVDELKRAGKRFSLDMLGAALKNKVMRRDEDKIVEPFDGEFVGYDEPHDIYRQVLRPAWPYLPADGALGEMVLSVGRAVYLHGKGVDGIVDISPFSCMNGIVSEAIYHAVSRDHDGLPIRNFYFDSTSSNMERDLDIFLELAESYRKRKRVQRRYPAYFES